MTLPGRLAARPDRRRSGRRSRAARGPGLAGARDGVPDPRRPAVGPSHRPPRPIDGHGQGRPAVPSRPLDGRSRSGPRPPDRGDAHLQADPGAARPGAPGADRARRRCRLARGGADPGNVRPRGPGADGRRARRAAWRDRITARPDAGPGSGAMRTPRWRRPWTNGSPTLDEPFEGDPWPVLADALPDGAMLWAASSMPVRDLDALAAVDRSRHHGPLQPGRQRHRRRRVHGPRIRGGGGRAGRRRSWATSPSSTTSTRSSRRGSTTCRPRSCSSTTTGAGSSRSCPRRGRDPRGGFGAPGALRGAVRDAARDRCRARSVEALGGEHRRVSRSDLRPPCRTAWGGPGIRVLELRTDRARNLELHRQVAARAPRDALAGPGAVHVSTSRGIRSTGPLDAAASGPAAGALLHGFTGAGASWLEQLDAARGPSPGDRPGPPGPRRHAERTRRSTA